MHLTTAECACRHNYGAVGKLGKTINLKIPWRYENIVIQGQIASSIFWTNSTWLGLAAVLSSVWSLP